MDQKKKLEDITSKSNQEKGQGASEAIKKIEGNLNILSNWLKKIKKKN